jgi:hypothetical protein
MPVATKIRCQHIDPETGIRCTKKGTTDYGNGNLYCNDHEPLPEHDENDDLIEYPDEIDPEVPDDFGQIIPFPVNDDEEPEPEPATSKRFSGILCHCGCGYETLKGRIYLQGHDQRHKGILIKRATVYGDETAAEELIRKGWRDRAFIQARRTEEVAKQERLLAKRAGSEGTKTTVVMEFEAQ